MGWLGFPGESIPLMKGTPKSGALKKANEKLWVVLLEDLDGRHDGSQGEGPCLAGLETQLLEISPPLFQRGNGVTFVRVLVLST